jgi:hypothetical protein
MLITEERIKELEAAHGTIAHVRGANGQWEVVLRKPKRAEYKVFRSMSTRPETKADAQENLVRRLMVEPADPKAIDALLEDWVGIPEACTKALYDLTGMTAEELGK